MSTSQNTPNRGPKARPTYPQQWSAYNAAQVHEKDHVADLLHSICETIPSPEQLRGRPRVPLGEAIFAAVMKVYGTTSGRRNATEVRDLEAKGYLSRPWHFSSIFKTLENPKLTPILKHLIEESAQPLRDLETDFAVDSSGFSSATYKRWFDHKYGREMSKGQWVKAHIMVGVKTNIVTSVEVTNARSNDSPHLPHLLGSTGKGFNVKTVAADKGYISHSNLEAIDAAGAFPLIPFKSHHNPAGAYWRKDRRNSPESRELWQRMHDFYMHNNAEFRKHYHKRSNVETTFAMIKAKFGSYVRSRTLTAQINEVLCKVLCHNLCCLVHASYEAAA
ncbi:MAG: transposase [Candidatus Cybelea sp.]